MPAGASTLCTNAKQIMHSVQVAPKLEHVADGACSTEEAYNSGESSSSGDGDNGGSDDPDNPGGASGNKEPSS